MIALILALAAVQEDVPGLIKQLREAPDLSARYRTASLLERSVKPQDFRVLVQAIDAGPEDVRPFLIRALAGIPDGHAKAKLQQLCKTHGIPSRAEAAYQLRRFDNDLSGMKLLPGMLQEAESDGDKRAVLQKLYGTYGAGKEGVDALVAFLGREADRNLRRYALQVLGTYRDDAAASAALRKLADDGQEELRREALAQLIRLGDAKALEEGFAALEADEVDVLSAYQIVNAIQGRRDPAHLPRLRKLLERAADATLKTALIRALAYMKDKEAVPLLQKLEQDENDAVAKAAISALLQIEGKSNPGLLQRASEGGDPLQQLEAAEKLLELDRPEGYEAIRKLVAPGTTSGYRQRAVLALGIARRRESVEILLPLLDDSDAAVAKSAKTTLVSILTGLHPYLKFDEEASPEAIRAWWKKRS